MHAYHGNGQPHRIAIEVVDKHLCAVFGLSVLSDFGDRGGEMRHFGQAPSGYDARHMLPDRSEIDPVLVTLASMSKSRKGKVPNMHKPSRSPLSLSSSSPSPDILLSVVCFSVLIELHSLGYYSAQTVSMNFSLEHAYQVSTRLCPDAALSYGLSQPMQIYPLQQKSFCACRNREFIALLLDNNKKRCKQQKMLLHRMCLHLRDFPCFIKRFLQCCIGLGSPMPLC